VGLRVLAGFMICFIFLFSLLGGIMVNLIICFMVFFVSVFRGKLQKNLHC